MRDPTQADLDWLIDRFDLNSHYVETEGCVSVGEHDECTEERNRARQIVDGMRAILTEER